MNRIIESTVLRENLLLKLSELDTIKIHEISNGNPLVLNLCIQYLNKGYDVNKITQLISNDFYKNGFLSNNGLILDPSSPEFSFLTNDIQVINKSLLGKVQNNPNYMYNLSPREFEEMVAELMYKKGYSVDLTKQTRDGGKDLIIANHQDIGDFIYYVECKRFSSHRPVGVNLVRELVGTIYADRVTAGIMITSSYFSPDAIEYSNKFKNQMSLIDYVKLKEWLKLI